MALALLAPQASQAATIYTGSLSNSVGSPAPGVVANGVWDNSSTSFSWTVKDVGTNPGGFLIWEYSYTLSVGNQGNISHFIVELSPGFTTGDLLTELTNTEIGTFGQQGNSNPGIPGDIFGIKFDKRTSTTETVTFQTLRAPVWGDFYAKDGKAGGVDNYVYNAGFSDADPVAPAANGSVGNHILRPDTTVKPPAEVPLPPAAWLLGSALLGLVAISRRDRKPVA